MLGRADTSDVWVTSKRAYSRVEGAEEGGGVRGGRARWEYLCSSVHMKAGRPSAMCVSGDTSDRVNKQTAKQPAKKTRGRTPGLFSAVFEVSCRVLLLYCIIDGYPSACSSPCPCWICTRRMDPIIPVRVACLSYVWTRIICTCRKPDSRNRVLAIYGRSP